MTTRRLKLRIAATVLLLSVAGFSVAQLTVTTIRLSQSVEGIGQLGSAGRPSLSANGQLFAFSSTAENLIPNDTNNRADVFVGTVGTAGLRRVSVGRFGIQGNGGSFNPATSPQSPNGFVAVVYASDASNIGRGLVRFPDNNDLRDIYFSLPNRKNFTKRVTYGVGGIAPNGVSRNPSVTIVPEPNRMLVAYQSAATNLIGSDTNGVVDIYLTTVLKAEDETDENDTSNSVGSGYSNQRVSVPNDPATEANGPSTDPDISGSGDFVVFESMATNLVTGQIPSFKQVYLRNLVTGTTELISKAPDGTPGDADSFNATVSYQGTFIVYCTGASNILTDGKTSAPSTLQVVLYNRLTKRSSRVNVSSTGEVGNGPLPLQFNAEINPTGRLVFFSDLATNLVTSDTNGTADVFVRDTINLTTTRIPSGFDGSESNGVSGSVSIGQSSFSSATSVASFLSTASNLVVGDTEGNEDVFASTFQIPPATYNRRTVLEVPADVTPTPDRATLTFQKFTTRRARAASSRAATTNKPKVEYAITLFKENPDLTRSDVRRKTSTRANVTFRNLSPGVYVSQYRTQLNSNGKITSKSKPSPQVRFAVGTPTPTPTDE